MLLPSTKKQNKFWLTFALCALAAACILIPFWVVDRGIFLYAGDFNSQQISFSYHINEFIEAGGGSFDWATDLGSGFINSYSFYLLGSPFFWLASLLPAAAQPFLMVPLLCLKFGTAGAGAYLWLKRYCDNQNYAVLGGALYALSGFTVYNVFFNHFVDVVALFPFLLWALDATILDRRRGLLPPLVALNLLVNYFFFAGQIVFLFLYFICMCLAKQYKITWKLFFQLAFECLLGCGIGCFLAFPALLSLQNNPRTFKMANGNNLLMYSKPQQYFAIFASLLFPPDPPYLPAIFDEGAVIKWTSLSAYLPAVGFAGALAYLRGKKGTAWRKLLFTCFVFALVPVLNSSFYALNSSYYARWYYMPILILCGATVYTLEHQEEEALPLASSVKAVAVLALAYTAFALIPNKEDEEWTIGVVNDQAQFWLGLILTLAGLALFWGVWRSWEGARRPRALLALVLAFGCLYSVIHISIGKFAQWNNDHRFVEMCYEDAPKLEFPEEGFFRTDSYGCHDNLALWMNRPSLQFFNSTVAPSIMEFYPAMGVKRDVNSKPDIEENALRGLLGVKYLICDVEQRTEFEEKELPGWEYAGEQDCFVLYRNENVLPMGFAYDFYITQEQLDSTAKSSRAQLLCKAILLDEEQEAEYGHLFQPLPDDSRMDSSYESWQQAVEERRIMAVSSFDADSWGFTARITLENENLVFFSVPWDQGFEATVNGEEAPVLKVNSGLMAVPAPAGENEIRLTYHTPGLRPALMVSAGCSAVYLVYLASGLLRRRGRYVPKH